MARVASLPFVRPWSSFDRDRRASFRLDSGHHLGQRHCRWVRWYRLDWCWSSLSSAASPLLVSSLAGLPAFGCSRAQWLVRLSCLDLTQTACTFYWPDPDRVDSILFRRVSCRLCMVSDRFRTVRCITDYLRPCIYGWHRISTFVTCLYLRYILPYLPIIYSNSFICMTWVNDTCFNFYELLNVYST